MPRIPVHTVDSAPDESREVLEGLAAKFGKVLNIHGEMAHAPVVLHAYAALQRVINDHGSFDGRTKEAIALAVAAVDDCDYCQAAHTAGGQAAGLTEDETVAIRKGTYDGDPKLAALLAVTREATAAVGHVAGSTWQAALDAGWREVELTELTVHVVVNLFTNYFNHLVGTELDLPTAPEVDAEFVA